MFDLIAVGELNVDIVFSGLKQLPVMGEEILGENFTQCMGSSTALCACASSALGLKTAFFGKLGMDAYGTIVSDTLERFGIDTSHLVRSPEYRTGVTVSMNLGKDRALLTCFGDTIDGFCADDVPLEKLGARHLHVGSYFLQTKLHSGLTSLFRKAHALGMTTSLDAGWDEKGRWSEAMGDVLSETDFFFPNEKECVEIARNECIEDAARIIASRGCTAVVKLGEEGSLACTKSGNLLRAGAFRANVVDTTGAGDNFNAGFLSAFLSGKPLDLCLKYGNAAGAVSVGYEGGCSHRLTMREMEDLIRKNEA